MRKYLPDVNVSETCIDANLKMTQRTFPVSRHRNDARGQYPKLPLTSQLVSLNTSFKVPWGCLRFVIVVILTYYSQGLKVKFFSKFKFNEISDHYIDT